MRAMLNSLDFPSTDGKLRGESLTRIITPLAQHGRGLFCPVRLTVMSAKAIITSEKLSGVRSGDMGATPIRAANFTGNIRPIAGVGIAHAQIKTASLTNLPVSVLTVVNRKSCPGLLWERCHITKARESTGHLQPDSFRWTLVAGNSIYGRMAEKPCRASLNRKGRDARQKLVPMYSTGNAFVRCIEKDKCKVQSLAATTNLSAWRNVKTLIRMEASKLVSRSGYARIGYLSRVNYVNAGATIHAGSNPAALEISPRHCFKGKTGATQHR
jgi:hypothetical protein